MNEQPRVGPIYGTSGPWAVGLLGIAFAALAVAVVRRVLKAR